CYDRRSEKTESEPYSRKPYQPATIQTGTIERGRTIMAEQKSAPTPEDLVRELSSFPLLGAMFGRRARRFGLGMKIPDGPLAYESPHEPVSLSEAERMLLVMCGAGINGWNTGMEHTSAGEAEQGCTYRARFFGGTYQRGGA